MIYGPFSKYVDSADVAVAPGVVIDAEGLALVRNKSAQSQGVMPSTGTAADLFAGFSYAGTSAAPFAEGYAVKVESGLTSLAPGVVSLVFAPVANSVLVIDASTGAAITTFTVSGKTLTGIAAGTIVNVTYKYALSVVQARALYGDIQPGGYSGAYIDQIGLVKRGVIYTDQFDSSKNWAAATDVKMAAGGQLTDQSGSGLSIPCQIVALPGVEVPFLGLEFSAV
jgi:hypothetical protein